MIQDGNGILLVRNRTRTDEKWDLPGGGIEPGETPVGALRREIKEGVDMDITGEPILLCNLIEYFYDLDGQQGWEFSRYFYVVVPKGKAHLNGNADDIIAARYFNEPLSSDGIAPVAREIITMAHIST